MSQTVITSAFEQLKAQEAANGGVVILDEFVFANIPNLDITSPIDRGEGLPEEAMIVHRQAVGKTGMVNNNAVVYSVVMGADVGDFEFNWVGLVNKANNVVAMIVHAPTQKKIKTATGQQGNVLTRSFLMEYNGASEQTQIITPADTWQIDFTARLNGVDERMRAENVDIYGDSAFFKNGFLVTRNGSQYSVQKGTGYVAGIRAELEFDQVISVDKLPIKVWVDTCWRGTLTSIWGAGTRIILADDLQDYYENDEKHHVCVIAEITAEGAVNDLRYQSGQYSKSVLEEINSKQPLNPILTAFSGLVSGKDKLPYFKEENQASMTQLTELGRRIIGAETTEELVDNINLKTVFFEDGFTISSNATICVSKELSKTLIWNGEYPKTVRPGDTPYSSGGMGGDAWITIASGSPNISNFIGEGALADQVLSVACAIARKTTGTVLIDIDCVVDSFIVPEGIILKILPYKKIVQKENASGDMFILSDNSLIKSDNKKGRLRGNSASQSSIRRCISATGVTGAGVDGVDIRDFNSYGAYFENCEDTFCRRSTIRDITVGAVETAAGQYITNCIGHESEYNDIRDTDSNGIKFRADTSGLTRGCSSFHDKVTRAGFIGIAHSKIQDHTTSHAYCVDCVDNGMDMNGCQNVTFIHSTCVRCQDGFYLGENGINNCHVISCSARNCKRAGVGSLGALVMCSVVNTNIDGCGCGIYLSGFNVFKIRGGMIMNCVKNTYVDNEDKNNPNKMSTGIGIHIQSDLASNPACTNPDIQGVTFMNNAGYDIALGNAGIIGALRIKDNAFLDNAGDGKINYGAATLADPVISNNVGYLVERTVVYYLNGDGKTVEFTLSLPQNVIDTGYRIVSVETDWLTTSRYLDETKGKSYFGLTFGTAPGTGTRRVNVKFERLRPES